MVIKTNLLLNEISEIENILLNSLENNQQNDLLNYFPIINFGLDNIDRALNTHIFADTRACLKNATIIKTIGQRSDATKK